MLSVALLNVPNNADWSRAFQLRTAADVPVPITGWDMQFAVKATPQAHEAYMLLGVVLGGIEITNGAQGKFTIHLPYSRLKRMAAGRYVHDLIRVDGESRTQLWRGTLDVVQGITP